MDKIRLYAKSIITLIINILIIVCTTSAQSTVSQQSENLLFSQALELYNQNLFGAALLKFEKVENQTTISPLAKSDAEYYSAICAIELHQKDAALRITNYMQKYPDSPHTKFLYFMMGKFNYREGNYDEALQWFEQTDFTTLTDEQAAEFYFKSGYAYFTMSNFIDATKAFNEVKDSQTDYAAPATYYLAHIAYSNNLYEPALQSFERLKNDERFAPLIPYYITHIYYLQKKFDKVVQYAPPLLDSANAEQAPEIARLIGDSYTKLQRYNEAVPFLERYKKTAKSHSRSAIYNLAYAYYTQKKYDIAASTFEEVITSDDSLAHNTYYLLGDCYLKLDKKDKARMAFFAASNLDYYKDIKQNALLNFAKLTYELSYSPFNETIKAFNEYILLYPQSPDIDEAYKYLVMFYTSTKNFKDALIYLEKIKQKSDEIERAYQRVTFYRGIELFNNIQFAEAIIMFDKSLQYPESDDIKARCFYWKGEALYRIEKYAEAIKNYQAFQATKSSAQLDENQSSHYGLGYALLKEKKYEQAKNAFENYLRNTSNENPDRVTDAVIRLGDCYFINRNYSTAITQYDKVVVKASTGADYCLFQKGFCFGLLGNTDSKQRELNLLIKNYPQSIYVDDALFEAAKGYMSTNNNAKALEYFNTVANQYASSSYASKALLSIGLIYYNQNENIKALEVYEKVITQYPKTQEAKTALSKFKNIYIAEYSVDKYLDYVKKFGDLGNVTVSEQDSLTYFAAEEAYIAGNCAKSKLEFGRYIERFKQGFFIINAHYYKAMCHYQDAELTEALKSFNYINSQPKNTFTEISLVKAATIQYNSKDYSAAIINFQKLEQIAEIPANVLIAREGIMQSYFFLEKYDEAITAVAKVLNTEKISVEQSRKSHYILAKSHFAKNNMASALTEFKLIAQEVQSVEGAESKFMIAEIYYRQAQMKLAEQECRAFINSSTPQLYWLAKSVVLLGDIFTDKKDYFQAKATYQSIIDNYENESDGIKDLAKKKLEIIREIEKAIEKGEETEIEIHFEQKKN